MKKLSLDSRIKELGLSTRANNCAEYYFFKHNIMSATISDLVKLTENEVSRMQGAWIKILTEIKKALGRYGYALKDSEIVVDEEYISKKDAEDAEQKEIERQQREQQIFQEEQECAERKKCFEQQMSEFEKKPEDVKREINKGYVRLLGAAFGRKDLIKTGELKREDK